ncbi:bifunctional 2',3'-cyclic-nucleotide 2'-phosphodiesterase/3'-nucleotidase [Deinococcus misasensis]|uniref:bifunctional 2',3'-cyclic-nucleotide 2'-phosphodiesterase/3'-nucleotidase n=1 Tax=Deinococcus misasensis TaxID=392413 RepID=UPI00055804F5|nr:bifunctional 2',3'-cyclic-nucleotide 2'-phosphodiesterase/3'-nucleotidase [Deinococcus misasensis]
MKHLKHLSLMLIMTGVAQAATVELRIMETTDIHVNVLNYDYYQDKSTDEYGLARTATLIRQARQEARNSMLFDNGDLIQGNPLGDYVARVDPLQEGETHPVYKAMNLLDYDLGNIGNHEFNYGLDFLKLSLKGANFPYVNANVYDAEGRKNYFKPYRIITKVVRDENNALHTIKVGVIGFVPPQILLWDKANLEGKVTTRDIVETAQKFVPEMKAKGADVVVAIAHSGLGDPDPKALDENETAGLSKVPGIDVILFGHSHAEFPSATYATYPGADVKQGTLNGVAAVMPGFWGNNLGVVDLKLEKKDGKWTILDRKGTIRPIFDKVNKKALVESDPAVVQAVADDHQHTLDYVRGKVADLEAPINSYFAVVQDDPSVQIVSQAQMWYAKRMLQGTEYDKYPILSAAAPFKAGGRAGASYYTDIPAGTLAIKNISDLYIYPNTIKGVLITGAQVQEWLERSAGQFKQIDPKGPANQELIDTSFPTYNFDVIDGVTYEIDVTQPSRYNSKGEVVNAGAHRIKNLMFEGKPINPEQKFIVVTNNYRAGGGGSFPGLNGKNIVLDSPDENREAIIQYMVAQGKINPTADNNWKLSPIPGQSVLFLSSPNAEKYLPSNAKKIGTTPDGFAQYQLGW